MSIIRSIDSFSLPELFKLIGNESRSGRAIVETPISQTTTKRQGIYYLWFKDGYLIAISNCLNQKGLINAIAARKWLNPAIVSQLRKLCPTGTPLGVYLRKMKLLEPEKLNLIFQLQLHQVYRLFQLKHGRFNFESSARLPARILTLPWLEMTGHRLDTREVSLYALRLMENTDNFKGLLPAPSQILSRITFDSRLKLTTAERDILNRADSKTSLLNISREIGIPVDRVRAIAFRLSAVGLVDTIFLPALDWENIASEERISV